VAANICTCIEIAARIKTITCLFWYREVDSLASVVSLSLFANGRACSGNLTNNDQAKDPTRGPWGRRAIDEAK